jgi:hypothetical protein
MREFSGWGMKILQPEKKSRSTKEKKESPAAIKTEQTYSLSYLL